MCDSLSTGAVEYGNRNELVNKATDRVLELQAEGNDKARVYGLDEVAGTGTMFVLENEPEYYGLPAEPQVSLRARIWNVIFKPLRVLVVLAVTFALWSNRSESKKIQDATAARGKDS